MLLGRKRKHGEEGKFKGKNGYENRGKKGKKMRRKISEGKQEEDYVDKDKCNRRRKDNEDRNEDKEKEQK